MGDIINNSVPKVNLYTQLPAAATEGPSSGIAGSKLLDLQNVVNRIVKATANTNADCKVSAKDWEVIKKNTPNSILGSGTVC